MSIRSETEVRIGSAPTAAENLSSNFVSFADCKIEDIDRALFNLFDKDLPLLYTQRNDTKRVPVVFATGERFALIARKKPLRDKSNTLILPVISIMRSSIMLGHEAGNPIGTVRNQIVKRQLSQEDSEYQKILNKYGFQNSDSMPSDSSFLDSTNQTGNQPGRFASRRSNVSELSNEVKSGNVLDPKISGNNIYEIYEVPPPVFVTVEYEVTFWTQYVQEMNNLISAMASEAHFYNLPSFRIETDKGYYFVAYPDRNFSNQSNFDEFSEEERLVRMSFSIKVPGYIIGFPYTGAENKIRKYTSSPQIVFENIISSDPPLDSSYVNVASGDPKSFILDNVRTVDSPLPGQSIGKAQGLSPEEKSEMVGSTSNSVGEKYVQTIQDPFDNRKNVKKIVVTKTYSTRQGESVVREVTKL